MTPETFERIARQNVPRGKKREGGRGKCVAPATHSSRTRVFEGPNLVAWLIDQGRLLEAKMLLEEMKAKREEERQQIIREVRAHAEANYEKEGWDFIVEAMTDSEIYGLFWEEFAGIEAPNPTTVEEAIGVMGTLCKIKDERRNQAIAWSEY